MCCGETMDSRAKINTRFYHGTAGRSCFRRHDTGNLRMCLALKKIFQSSSFSLSPLLPLYFASISCVFVRLLQSLIFLYLLLVLHPSVTPHFFFVFLSDQQRLSTFAPPPRPPPS